MLPNEEAAIHACAELGDAWVRYQTARIRQRHLQLGRHFRLDLDALLRRVANDRFATDFSRASRRR